MAWRCLFSFVDAHISFMEKCGVKALYGDAPFLGFRILGILVEEMRTLIELDEGSVFKPSVDVQTMIVGTMNNFLDSSLQMICAAHSCPEAVQIARITCLKHLFRLDRCYLQMKMCCRRCCTRLQHP